MRNPTLTTSHTGRYQAGPVPQAPYVIYEHCRRASSIAALAYRKSRGAEGGAEPSCAKSTDRSHCHHPQRRARAKPRARGRYIVSLVSRELLQPFHVFGSPTLPNDRPVTSVQRRPARLSLVSRTCYRLTCHTSILMFKLFFFLFISQLVSFSRRMLIYVIFLCKGCCQCSLG